MLWHKTGLIPGPRQLPAPLGTALCAEVRPQCALLLHRCQGRSVFAVCQAAGARHQIRGNLAALLLAMQETRGGSRSQVWHPYLSAFEQTELMCSDEDACALPESGVQSKANKVWQSASAGIAEEEGTMWTTEDHRRSAFCRS